MKNLEQIYFVLINLFLIVVSTLFGLHQIDNQYFFTAFVFIVIALLDSINLYKNRQDIEFGSTILVYLAMTFILILYFGVTENYVGAPWLFQVVLYSYSLLGLKKGIIACSIFFITLIGIHIGYFVLGVPFPYNIAFTFSYAIALLILSVGVFFYAYNVNQMVQEKNKKQILLVEALKEINSTQKKLIKAEEIASTAQVVVGIAHQLNTPIGNCLVGGSYISDETNTMLNNFNNKKISEKSLQRYLNNMVNISKSICTSLCNATDLIKKFKLLSLNEHLEDKKKFNLKELILSNVITQRLKSEHPLIDFKLTVPINLTVVSYSNAFCLALTHLIENSITHAFEDHQKGLIEITISTTEQSLLMKYQDNGKGVEQQILDKMFTPFYTSKMAKKQGLGLSILHTLIHHKLHGELNYSSELGKGLTINIIIPLSELEVTSECHSDVVNYDI